MILFWHLFGCFCPQKYSQSYLISASCNPALCLSLLPVAADSFLLSSISSFLLHPDQPTSQPSSNRRSSKSLTSTAEAAADAATVAHRSWRRRQWRRWWLRWLQPNNKVNRGGKNSLPLTFIKLMNSIIIWLGGGGGGFHSGQCGQI
jgi:hypothetical protein